MEKPGRPKKEVVCRGRETSALGGELNIFAYSRKAVMSLPASTQHGFGDDTAKETDPLLPSKTDNPTQKRRYTKRQWLVFGAMAVVMFFSAMVYSLQGPFFPKEAESKGVAPTVYGFVFGVFELVDFIFCPIYGNFIGIIGPKFMLNAGNFVMASCCIIFGFLSRSLDGTTFISLAFAVRIVEALGHAAYLTAAYAIIAYEFPNHIATTFSVLETLAAVGVVIGPSVGGSLYEAGGFLLPFAAVGSFLMLIAITTACALPQMVEDNGQNKPSFLRLLRMPSVLISYYVVVAAAFTFSFLQPVLEPYMRQFDLSPSAVSLLFVINGGVYALTATMWGFLADRYVNPKLLCVIGGIFTIAAFLLIGPAVFIPLKPSLWLITLALVLHGIGAGAEYVSAFLDCNRTVIKNGFPNNTEVYGMISGLWASGFALGSFLGPSISGVLYSAIGFQHACLVNVGLHFIVIIFNFAYLIYERRSARAVQVEIPD